MKRQLPIVGVAVLLLTVGLSGCEEVKSFTCDDRLVGAWKSRQTYMETLMFFPDGTWTADRSSGTWNIENEKLVITKGIEGGIVFTYDYSFSNDGNRLTLKDVDSLTTYIYTKL